MIIRIDPCPAPRMVYSDRWRKRKPVVKYMKYRENLRMLVSAKKYEQRDTLFICFVVAMPKSWSNKKKQKMLGKPHQQRPDLDNYIKAFLDSLLEEDSNVHYIQARKIWGENGCIIINE